MGILQQLGRSLMLPTIALPIAAILLRLGDMPWMDWGMSSWGELFTLSGQTIFQYIPIIFAVGVALGLTESAGIAGMSAMLGYFIFTRVIEHVLGTSFQLGVSGGILIGLLTAYSFHICKNIILPEYIQFFGGPRMVPLIMGFVSLFAALIMIVLGPYLQQGMNGISSFILGLGGFGTFVYGIGHRLLVPSGLHHILNNFFWFQLGAFESSQQITYGDLPRYFAGDPSAGIYMAGLYPITMFALPAIAFAIIHEAREDLKPKVKATFIVAALTSFLTGITEPIEFAFLFVAPYLFMIHAVLAGSAMWVAYELNIRHGFSYSSGVIDYLINEHLSQNGWLLIPIGLLYGCIYYVLFRYAIRRFQIPTPGRDEGSKLEEWAGDIPYRTPLILQALGGKDNIKNVEACITRLRLTVTNDRLIDHHALKQLGAVGVIHLGAGNIQVVFGAYSEMIREEILKVMRKDIHAILFYSPVQGKMIPLEDVPDPIYANKIVGQGVAFLPTKGECVSPIEGEIVYVFPTGHALGIRTKEGLEILLHIGIDSMHMHGFTVYVKSGDWVKPGQLLIRFQLKHLKKHAKSIATLLVITNSEKVRNWNFAPYTSVQKGQASVMSVVLTESKIPGGVMV